MHKIYINIHNRYVPRNGTWFIPLPIDGSHSCHSGCGNPVIPEDSFRPVITDSISTGRMPTPGGSYNTQDDILYWTVVIKMTGLGRQFLKWDDVE